MELKKIKLLLVAVLTLGFIFSGCKKQELINPENQEKKESFSKEDIMFDIKVENGILIFDNEDEFTKVYDFLEDLTSQKNYSFENLKTKLKHHSLMEKYLKEEEKWLNNVELDFKNDPDDKYVPDDIYRILLNEEGELIIANSIYKFTENFTVYKINNLNWESLNLIRDAQMDYDDYSFLKDVELLNCNCKDEKTSYSCKQNYTVSGTDNYQTGKLVKWKASIINLPAITRVKAETWSYKLSGTKWVSYSTDIQAQVYSFTYYLSGENGEYQCKYGNIGNTHSGASTHRIDDNVEARCGMPGVGGHPFWIRNNTINTYYYCNGWSKSYTISW